jgi:ABC-type transport system involved in multi-copper enzyme maturation permease subunit
MLGIGNYLWRLIPANPILLRVIQSGGKRKRDLLIRSAYLGALVFLVVFLLLNSAGSLASASLSDLAKQSAEIFRFMSYVQLALVALLAPIFTAGAITQERDSQTYDILLSTPLTNGQIVLGSLLSRLFFVVALLVSGIPIFSITQIFGGVAIKSIALSCLIACATAFITGAIAMAIAVFKVGTRRTIFSFYLVIALYLAVPLSLEEMGYFQYRWNYSAQGELLSHISWFAGLHPFLALRVIFGDPAYQPPDLGLVAPHHGRIMSWYLSSPHTFFISFMFALSFLLVMPSILMLRRLAQSTRTFRAWLLQLLRLSSGDRTRRPRYVWANPIAWREAKTRASANRALLLRYGFMTAGIGAAVTLAVLSTRTVSARMVVGAAGFDPYENVVSIVDGEQPRLYRVRPRRADGAPATLVTLEGRPASPDALRPGMVIDEASFATNGEVITTIALKYPRTVLSMADTRAFLLGAIMVEVAVILLILTQSAASTVTREKEDGTLDLLLATPITSRYYIWGKLRGLVSFVLPLIAVPVASILIFVVVDLFRSESADPAAGRWIVFPETILVLPATLIMVTAFAAILGMQMSLRCRKTVMAVMSSVGIVGGISGLLYFCGQNIIGSSTFEQGGLLVGAFSPFTLIAMLVNPLGVAPQTFGSPGADIAASRVFIFFGGWAACVCYGLIVWGMYKSMVYNFDMTIRRQAL